MACHRRLYSKSETEKEKEKQQDGRSMKEPRLTGMGLLK